MLKKILPSKMSVVVYRERKNPQLFHIAPTLPIFFLVIMPTVALISLLLLLGGIRYFHSLRQEILSMVPTQVKNLQADKAELQNNLLQTRSLISTLQNKIASSAQSGENIIFPLFKIPLAHEDQSQVNIIRMEEFKVITGNSLAKLRFRIINTSDGAQKLSGRIFVLLQQLNKITVHPPNSMENEHQQIYYTSGESFAASRFRPVEIAMPIREVASRLKFTILVFSRTGDLISKQEYLHNYRPTTSTIE
jgi:hypothetical protein